MRYAAMRTKNEQLEDLRLRLTAAHEKDLAKLHSKLAKLEQTKADYKKDRDESTKERDGLKSEIRTFRSSHWCGQTPPAPKILSDPIRAVAGHLTSKLGKTTALLEKHQSALPSLQSKLEAMSASHAASAARKDAELATTRGRLSELEKRLAAEIERRQGVEEERDQWDRRARRERQGREEAATAAGEAVRAVRAAADERDTERLVELHADRTAHVRLERQLADRKAQVESLAAYASTLEARLSLAEEDRARSDRDQRFVLLEAWHAERDLNAPLTSGQSGGGRAEMEKEWRQRARADAREVEGLREEVALARVEEEVLSALHGETLRWEHEREKSWKAERAAAKKALQATEHE